MLLRRQFRLLIDIDDLKAIAALEMFFADATNVLHRFHRAAGVARDEQPEDVFRQVHAVVQLCTHLALPPNPASRTSSPTSTRSKFDRSPRMRFSGSGRRRISVGMA